MTEFEHQGWKYRFVSVEEATVELIHINNVTGKVVVPEEVEYQNQKCKVVAIRGEYREESYLYQPYDRRCKAYWTTRDVYTSIFGKQNKDNLEIVLPSSLKTIGDYSFYGCSGLTSITIPNGVTNIGAKAFRDCVSLRFITIPKSVTSIGDSAFYSCSNLMSITVLPEDVMIGEGVFGDTQWWKNQPDGFVYLGKILLGCKDDSIFENVKNAIDVTIDVKEGTTSIAANAFYNCRKIPAINLPKSLKCIGKSAFKGCKMLTSISIPSSIIRIGDNIFSTDYLKTLILTADSIEEYCKSGINEQLKNSYTSRILKIKEEEVTEVVIPDTVTSILPYAFARIPSITSVKIPDSVTSIGEKAFYDCSGLTSITIPNSITSIGGVAFSYCSGLTSITIPDSVTSIGESAFSSCSGLTSITIPNSVTSIGSWAFRGCTDLTSITIPNSVTSIGGYAFDCCKSLTSITIPYSVTTIGIGALRGCDKLDTIIIENTPENITFDFANDSDDQWISKVQFVGQPENVEQLKADMEGMINESPATSPIANRVIHGAWTLELAEDKSVKMYKNGELCKKTSPALRELAAEVGFTYDPGWNTRQFGSKLFAHLKN